MNNNCDIIVESEKLLQNVIKKLGWSDDFLTQRENYVQCPFDKNHWIPNKNNQSHISYCKLRSQGYQKDEIKAMIPTIESVQSSSNQSTNNWFNDPKWTTNLEVFSNTNIKRSRRSNDQVNEQTKIETLASIRNSKRRRKSYRGIHTAKKSYTEILREIIAQQFEMLQSNEEPVHSEEHSTSKCEFSRTKYSSTTHGKYDKHHAHYSDKYENISTPCSSKSKLNEDDSRFHEKNKQTYPKKSHNNNNNQSNYTRQHSSLSNINNSAHIHTHTHEKHKHSKHKHKKHHKHRSSP